jgi:hypothetical protein
VIPAAISAVFWVICGVIILPILYARFNDGWKIASVNLQILNDQIKFNPIAKECGDPLNVMNIELA